MIRLGVNIDHVATLRQARYRDDPFAFNSEPDPVAAAREAVKGGADCITLHLREDRRHIQDRDLEILRRARLRKLNLEMALAPGIVRIALAVRPDQATLVPENRREVTTEGGLDVRREGGRIRAAARSLRARGIAVSLFIDPDPDAVKRSAGCGADAVELHTGAYALARGAAARRQLARLARAAAMARREGLSVYAGHGLNYSNVRPVLGIPEVEELNIGHSIVSRAVFAGFREAVREMKTILKGAKRV